MVVGPFRRAIFACSARSRRSSRTIVKLIAIRQAYPVITVSTPQPAILLWSSRTIGSITGAPRPDALAGRALVTADVTTADVTTADAAARCVLRLCGVVGWSLDGSLWFPMECSGSNICSDRRHDGTQMSEP